MFNKLISSGFNSSCLFTINFCKNSKSWDNAIAPEVGLKSSPSLWKISITSLDGCNNSLKLSISCWAFSLLTNVNRFITEEKGLSSFWKYWFRVWEERAIPFSCAIFITCCLICSSSSDNWIFLSECSKDWNIFAIVELIFLFPQSKRSCILCLSKGLL